jgi:hypothetical protein
MLELLSPPTLGLPQLPRSPFWHAVPITPVDRMSACWLLPHPHGLPRFRGGSASTIYFRGLLRLHSYYGLPNCSPTTRGLYREASTQPVARLCRSQATRPNQQLSGRVLPPLTICAFGAHPKTSAMDFRFPLPEAAEFDSGRNGIVRTD